MINKLKDRIYAAFAISLVASYFGCFAYYLYFGIDISSYLSAEDLIMIFAKWIWLTGLFSIILLHGLSSFFKRIPNHNNWWDKTIKQTSIKRRIFIILPILITLIILFIFYKNARVITEVIALIGFSLIIIWVSFQIVTDLFLKITELNKLKINKYLIFVIISTLFLIFGVPVIGGTLLAINLPKDKIIVTFDDDKLLSSGDSLNLIYVGKTHNNLFLYDKKSNSTIVYYLEKVKSLEIIQTIIKQK